MKVDSFFPEQTASTLYAMAGDDCSLFFDLDALNEKQAADHRANSQLTAVLQVCLLALGRSRDHVAMFEEFTAEPWRGLVERYHRTFTAAGFETVPRDHVVYGPRDGFYASIADRLPPVDLVSLYMVSGSNGALHRNPDALAQSRRLNSKFHFAEHAPAFGLNTPETFVTDKVGLAGAEARAFLERHLAADGAAMLKISGLAGARNVTSVSSIAEAVAYVALFDDDTQVLLQKKLDLGRYTEMTVDLRVTDTDITIANVRRILFADGVWVGNFVPAADPLTNAQRRELIRVGEYARRHGLGAPEGNNCGIDFFVGEDGEIVVTEINVRWTGGLFPTQAIARINGGVRDAVVCFDLVPTARMDAYMDFIEAHTPRADEGAFSCLSLGFGPFELEVAGVANVFVWHLVIGDFDAFRAERRRQLPGEDILPTTELIRLPG